MLTIKNIFLSLLLLGLLCVMVGCGAELTLQGSKVNVGKESDLKRCQMLGSTRLSLTPTRVKIMKEEQIKEQLIIEARNFAARVGGNMVLPIAPIEEGEQSFKIYNCPIFDD